MRPLPKRSPRNLLNTRASAGVEQAAPRSNHTIRTRIRPLSKLKPVKNPKHSKALQQCLEADDRLFRAEQSIRATSLEWMFDSEPQSAPSTLRPCINVTPPKQPP